jgi:hypothetical protein
MIYTSSYNEEVLNEGVEVFAPPEFTRSCQSSCGFQLTKVFRIGRVFVDGDDTGRYRVACTQRFRKKTLSK